MFNGSGTKEDRENSAVAAGGNTLFPPHDGSAHGSWVGQGRFSSGMVHAVGVMG